MESEQSNQNPTPKRPSNPAQQFHAHLLYKSAPEIDQAALLAALRKRFTRVESPDPKPGVLMFFFPDYLIPFKDGTVPAQCHLLFPPEQTIDLGRFETARQQSFHFAGAFDLLKTCRREVLLSDFFSTALSRRDRLQLFTGLVRSICEIAPPDLLFFLHPDRFDDPQKFLAAEGGAEPIYGLVNVRLFRNSEVGEGHFLMDTLGMHAMGLPDFQVQFTKQEPSAVAARLYDFADYLFEEGPVIKNGDRIQGVDGDQTWTCTLSDARVGPERVVFDLGE